MRFAAINAFRTRDGGQQPAIGMELDVKHGPSMAVNADRSHQRT
jgi:hypothetical protein